MLTSEHLHVFPGPMRSLESQLELELAQRTVARLAAAHLDPLVDQLVAAPVPGHLGQLAAELAPGPVAEPVAERPGPELADLGR